MEEQDNIQPAPGFDDVFSNSLVWKKLGPYLHFGDLKALRLSCTNFNYKVITETNFNKRALVVLNQDRLQPSEFGTTSVLWKHFKIKQFCTENNSEDCQENFDMSWFYPFLASAESLSILSVHGPTQKHYPSLLELMEAPDRLNMLGLDVSILDGEENSTVFNNLSDKARLTLENLVEFDILSPGYRVLTHNSDSSFIDSTGMLATVMKNLQIIKVDDLVDEGMDGLPDTVDDQLQMYIQNLLGILEQNKDKMTKLSLDDMEMWSTSHNLQSLTTKIFPSLKTVLIRINQIESKNLLDFLRKQPLLEEIDLTVLHQFPNELLNGIRERGNNLKRLRLKTKGFQEPEKDMWNFLSELKSLEEIQLDFCSSNRFAPNSDTPGSVVINLPSCIKKISLRGFPYLENEKLTPPLFGNINPNILVKLSVKNCQDAVNNSTLEYICQNLKMLKVLEISEATNCTDYGFTGIDPASDSNESSFTLMNLKGLRSLTIKSCSKITNAMCKVIIFQELVYLDLSDNELINEEGIKIVLQNANPSLERLKTSELSEDFPTEEDISRTHPRFQPNGHVFADGSSSDDGDASMVHFPDGSSDFSGLDAIDDDYDGYYDNDFSEEDFDDDFDDY